MPSEKNNPTELQYDAAIRAINPDYKFLARRPISHQPNWQLITIQHITSCIPWSYADKGDSEWLQKFSDDLKNGHFGKGSPEHQARAEKMYSKS